MTDDIVQNLGYARVSGEEQANKKHGLETQINRLRKAGCTEIYQDVASGRSWGDAKREDFARICQLVKERKVRQITVTAIDRLSRESTASAKFLQTLEETGVLIYELDSDRYINFVDPNEWYESRQKGLQAELESRKISMRVKSGYQNLRDLHKANPRTPYGYTRVNQKYQQVPEEIEIAREAIALFFEHRVLIPVTRIIFDKHGKSWSGTGLRNWLINPVLCGHTPYDKRKPRPAHLPQGGQIIYDTHPELAIMTDAQQKQIVDILLENARIWGKNRNAFLNPLSGLVVCQECGIACDLLSKDSGGAKVEAHRIRSFYCRTRSKRPAGKSCSQRPLYKFEAIEAIAIQALTDKASAIAAIYEVDEQTENPKIKELQGQIAVLQSMNNPMLSDAIAKLQNEIENLERSHHVDLGNNQELRSLLIEAFSDPDFFDTLDNTEKRSLYKSLISRIVVRDREVVAVELKI